MIQARAQSWVPVFVFYVAGASLTLAYTAPAPLSSEAVHPGDRWVLSVLGSRSPLAPPSFSLGRWRGRCVTPLCAMRFWEKQFAKAVPPLSSRTWKAAELKCGARGPGSLPSSAPDKTGDQGAGHRDSLLCLHLGT